MTTSASLLVLLGVWLLTGVVTGIAMGRRGYSAFSWAILGAVFGPLVVPLAIVTVRTQPAVYVQTVTTAKPGAGDADVLVGVDGSPASDAAVRAVAGLMRGRLGRVAVARVLDYDTAAATMRRGERERAKAELDRAVRMLQKEFGVAAEGVLLAGPPATALVTYAEEGGFTLLAVGSRGRGASKRVLGSVATVLAERSSVPVMIVTAPAATARHAATA